MKAGTVVSTAILRKFRKLLPSDAELHAPYGATEALLETINLVNELPELYDSPGSWTDHLFVGYFFVGIELKINYSSYLH